MTQTVKRPSSLSPEQWQQVIDQQQASGMSQRVFCNTHNIGCPHLHTGSETSKEPVTAPKEPPEQKEWIELSPELQTASPTWHLELELPGGVTLRMRQ